MPTPTRGHRRSNSCRPFRPKRRRVRLPAGPRRICRRRGALNHRVDAGDIRLKTPLDDLALYTFHTHTARDYFCRTCGILPFRRPRTAPEKWTVNVRCLDGVDIDAIPVLRLECSKLP